MTRPPVIIGLAILAAFVSAGLLWHLGDLRAQRDQSGPTGQTVTIGGPFALTDQNGVMRTEKDYRGKYTLVFFGYTYCPDVCPTTLAVMSAALDKLGARADKIVPLFITVDPKRDTAAVLSEYLKSFDDRKVRERIGKAGGDYLEQIDALRERFDFTKQTLKAIAGIQRRMRRWARYAPMNLLHRVHLIDAERCRVIGQHKQAADF